MIENKLRKILVVFGTRPEAIKMAPLVKVLKSQQRHFLVKVCVTAQHRKMLDQVMDFFAINSDYDLDLMKSDQDLYSLSADILKEMKEVLKDFKPDFVLVHGDTTTSTMAALAAFYAGATVCHIEAGLRTFNKRAPFPEEMNRQITSRIADYHFAPTLLARTNLVNEGINNEQIFVTGNTVIDALLLAQERLKEYIDEEIVELSNNIDNKKKLILVTGHRRENFGDGFKNICDALSKIAERNDVQVIYPVHLNPNVQEPVYRLLSQHDNIRLIEPISYPAFVWLMKQSYLILTDSGGIQEEAPSLDKPVLVMRDITERPEAVKAGTVKLVGTSVNTIVEEVSRLLDVPDIYCQMTRVANPYGDGTSSLVIAEALKVIKAEITEKRSLREKDILIEQG